MFVHSPAGAAANAPLVVVLHGCSQGAADYQKAGWNELADRHGFHVVYAEQQQPNNSSRCFNWFQPTDATRDRGEAQSIRSMIEHMVSTAGVDRNRVFASGLSAGGGMTTVVLATYPEVFAAGAVNAGLPYDCARNVGQAFTCMAGGVLQSPRQWGDRVRAAHPGYRGPYPRVTIWQGTADRTVAPANATEMVEQWTDVHGTDATADTVETVRGHKHSVYRTADGRPVVDSYSLTGMGHATAVDPGSATDQGGAVGPFFVDVNLHSTYHAGRFFGLVP
jgi:poly(hydroxyalkanoate) depolymerase family esterase